MSGDVLKSSSSHPDPRIGAQLWASLCVVCRVLGPSTDNYIFDQDVDAASALSLFCETARKPSKATSAAVDNDHNFLLQ
jgi:hypothetical protein